MKFVKTGILAAAIAAAVSISANAATRVGVLRCYVDGGPSFIVGSSHGANCVFSGQGSRRERYSGRVNHYGLDVGFKGKSVIVWAVYAPTEYRGRALRGSYIGATANASIGVGGGGNILVGGNNRTISLQPLSVSAETGVALGLGVGDLELR